MSDLIGVFDSGMGGISVLHTLHTLFPHENFLYYGDNANAPYGVRPLEEIQDLTDKATNVLVQRGVKAIVIACNTATSAYGDILKEKVDIPVIGMEPAIKQAQDYRNGGNIIALATKATLSLPRFQKSMESYGEGVIPVIGQGWVEVVESGQSGTETADRVVAQTVAEYRDKPVNSVVLGCTHYPFLTASVKKCFPQAHIIDGRLIAAENLRKALEEKNLFTTNDAPGTIEYQTSGGEDTIRLMHSLMAYLDSVNSFL